MRVMHKPCGACMQVIVYAPSRSLSTTPTAPPLAGAGAGGGRSPHPGGALGPYWDSLAARPASALAAHAAAALQPMGAL